ncbi:MAG: hypothetical protein ACQEVA_14710, partial [Myxococcota bacterium]
MLSKNSMLRRPLLPRATMLMVMSLLVATAAFMSGCANTYNTARSLYDQEAYSESRERAQKGLEDDPKNPRLNLLVARTYLAEREYREALPYAVRAFRSDAIKGEAGRVLGKIQ